VGRSVDPHDYSRHRCLLTHHLAGPGTYRHHRP
jgi:hypothetical protein